jgi:hypothetical protein
MCGLNDWLDKDTISIEDVTTSCQILFYKHSEFLKKITRNNEDEVVIKHVAKALYDHNFYVSKEALSSLSSIFSNLLNEGRGSEESEKVKKQLLIFSNKI